MDDLQNKIKKTLSHCSSLAGMLDILRVATTKGDTQVITNPIATVKKNFITGESSKEIVAKAMQWVSENIKAPIKTKAGEVVVDARGIEQSLNHKIYQNKLDAIPAIKNVLEDGAFLGCLPDKDGNTIDNYFFAAKILIEDKEKIVLVRAREAKGTTERRFYLHEIYTEDEIRSASTGLNYDGQPRIPTTLADLNKMIIKNFLDVNSENEKISEKNKYKYFYGDRYGGKKEYTFATLQEMEASIAQEKNEDVIFERIIKHNAQNAQVLEMCFKKMSYTGIEKVVNWGNNLYEAHLRTATDKLGGDKVSARWKVDFSDKEAVDALTIASRASIALRHYWDNHEYDEARNQYTF